MSDIRGEQLISIMDDALSNTKARHPNLRGPFKINFPEDVQVKTLEEIERDHIRYVLNLRGGNMHETARSLDISRSTLYLKAEKYGIAREEDECSASREALADDLNAILWQVSQKDQST